MCSKIIALLVAVAAALPAVETHAETRSDYPSKLVRIVVPFPAGGGIDILVRSLGNELSQKWGQPVIIENKPGGGSVIGTDYVARTEPDGLTLLATVNETFTANRFLYKKLPYHPDKSFAPITEMVRSEQLVVVNSNVPVKDMKELVALAKREPGKVSYGSWGQGTLPHLAYSRLAKKEGLDLTHVPYKGIAQVMTSVGSGEIIASTGSGSVAGPLFQAGRIKPLAIASSKRSPQFPDVPTTQEQGFGYFKASIWYGLFAPAGTPPAIVQKINSDVVAILNDPKFAEKNITARSLTLVASSPKQLQETILEEVQSVKEMIQAANIQPE